MTAWGAAANASINEKRKKAAGTLGAVAGGIGGGALGGPAGAAAGAAAGEFIGKGIASMIGGGDEAPEPYTVNRKYFQYGGPAAGQGESERYKNLANRWHDPRLERQMDRSRSDESRLEALARIRGFEGQAASLQRMGMENARLQALAMAGGASPSTRAAALRAAQYANAQAQTGIAQSARERLLAEFAAQQQALAGLRQGDITTEGQGNAYSLGQREMMANQALAYEAMRQREMQFGANLAALGEQTQAGAYGQAIPGQTAMAMQNNAQQQQLMDRALSAAGSVGMYYMMSGQGQSNRDNDTLGTMAGTPYAPGASSGGSYGNWSF